MWRAGKGATGGAGGGQVISLSRLVSAFDQKDPCHAKRESIRRGLFNILRQFFTVIVTATAKR